jgi:hypothetical protein
MAGETLKSVNVTSLERESSAHAVGTPIARVNHRSGEAPTFSDPLAYR